MGNGFGGCGGRGSWWIILIIIIILLLIPGFGFDDTDI
jgi:flagellar basal body-associated protein FliL